jgi:hypothetical protein
MPGVHEGHFHGIRLHFVASHAHKRGRQGTRAENTRPKFRMKSALRDLKFDKENGGRRPISPFFTFQKW